MALNKIRQLDWDSVGVTLPKGDMRVEGIIDESGELEEDCYVHIRHVDEGQWSLELIEGRDLER